MPQFLLAVQLRDDFDRSTVDAAMEHDIDVINDEMATAGIRVFMGGLRPPGEAKSLRAQPDGNVLITDGPYMETKEHVGGFWIIEVADMAEALAWARKGAIACRGSIEVRTVWRPGNN
ncbi:MAG TPA: YciI family protein [Candidatus Angelobacter sp.]|nr:YciI family protein [Candidatus Angelobacter sp.]